MASLFEADKTNFKLFGGKVWPEWLHEDLLFPAKEDSKSKIKMFTSEG